MILHIRLAAASYRHQQSEGGLKLPQGEAAVSWGRTKAEALEIMRMLVNFAVSIVLALALVFGVRAFANLIFDAKPPAQPAVEIPELRTAQATKKESAAPAGGGGAQATAAVATGPDPAKGKKVFNKCKACHEATKEKNKVGPHLVGIVGRAVASVEGFKYSPAMQAKAAELGTWTEENLKQWLASPKTFIPGNKMAFAGLKKEEDIANLLAYLKSLGQ